jgi:hypothetical protein
VRLCRKIDVKVGRQILKVTVREGIALNTTNLALNGNPKLIPLVLAIEREISAIAERENIPKITEDMTPHQAVDTFMRYLKG